LPKKVLNNESWKGKGAKKKDVPYNEDFDDRKIISFSEKLVIGSNSQPNLNKDY